MLHPGQSTPLQSPNPGQACEAFQDKGDAWPGQKCWAGQATGAVVLGDIETLKVACLAIGLVGQGFFLGKCSRVARVCVR